MELCDHAGLAVRLHRPGGAVHPDLAGAGRLIDAVLTYHTDPVRCGVCKFNTLLANRLGVSVLRWHEYLLTRCPLLSIKPSEWSTDDLVRLLRGIDRRTYDLALHDYGGSIFEVGLAIKARRVFALNQAVAERLPCPSQTLWCPPMLAAAPSPDLGVVSVLTFGMAHKWDAIRHERLHALLEASGQSYSVVLSTALHDGYDDFGAPVAARLIYGDKLFWMGMLSDEALARYIRKAAYVAAFFEGGARANNSTIQSALALGAVVITNLDRHSPREWVHGENLLNLDELDTLPIDLGTVARLSAKAALVAQQYSWEHLVEALRVA